MNQVESSRVTQNKASTNIQMLTDGERHGGGGGMMPKNEDNTLRYANERMKYKAMSK